MQREKRHEALDGVRFFAALLVFIAHFQGLQLYYNLPFHDFDNERVLKLGAIGVTIFFVLSGFLITLSILNGLRSGSAHWIKKFYIRRILRIWPLYLLVVAVTFLLLNRIPF